MTISTAGCRLLTFLTLASVAVSGPSRLGAEARDDARRLTRQEFEDRVRGGWAGQMIGVSFGAPTEFHSNAAILEGPLPEWRPDHVSNAIDQDDLYVEMTFAEVMDRIGLDATTEQFGEAFRMSKYNLWHANAAARRLLNAGIEAPRSGQPEYNPHANDIDFQIESDFIGLMSPGLPRAARDYSLRVGRVMNSGDGLYGGLFITGMYAAAFFESDPRRVVEAGLAMLPPKSGYAAIIRDVLAWHDLHPDDWRATWHQIEDTWDRDDACPDGSLEPFNIDARLNGAYVALGLLYGAGDFGRTLDVATRSGQDSDCNPSSAAGILGVMLGYEKIPDEWKAGIPALAGKKFSYTDYSFDDIVASTVTRAEAVVRQAGGKVSETEIVVPRQSPQPPRLEQWDMGVPDSNRARRRGGLGVGEGLGEARPGPRRPAEAGICRRGRRSRSNADLHGHGGYDPRRILAAGRAGGRLPRRPAGPRHRRLDPRTDPRRCPLARLRVEGGDAHREDRHDRRLRCALDRHARRDLEGHRVQEGPEVA